MNADPTAPFRSEYVCNNLARRTVKEYGDQIARANAERFTQKLLLPVAKKLISAGRMPRGELGRMASNLVRQLANDRGVIDVELNSIGKKLSSNEEHRLAYILSLSDSPDWLDFVATELRMTRKKLTTNVCVTDVRIHRHALARYMQRELLPADRMLEDIAQTLHLSTLIGIAAATVEGGHIAIPLKRGLLLGNVSVLGDEGRRMVLTIDKDGPYQTETERGSFNEGQRVFVELMTYVDGDHLGPVKERLHAAIENFAVCNAVGAKAVFDMHYYTSSVIENQTHDEYMRNIAVAIKAATNLVRAPEWQAWLANVS